MQGLRAREMWVLRSFVRLGRQMPVPETLSSRSLLLPPSFVRFPLSLSSLCAAHCRLGEPISADDDTLRCSPGYAVTCILFRSALQLRHPSEHNYLYLFRDPFPLTSRSEFPTSNVRTLCGLRRAARSHTAQAEYLGCGSNCHATALAQWFQSAVCSSFQFIASRRATRLALSCNCPLAPPRGVLTWRPAAERRAGQGGCATLRTASTNADRKSVV